MSKIYDIVIIGGGAMGISMAVAAWKAGLSHIVLERGQLCDTFTKYPECMKFLTTFENSSLELGMKNTWFSEMTEGVPTRDDFLRHARDVVDFYKLNLKTDKTVIGGLDRAEDGIISIATQPTGVCGHATPINYFKAKNVVVCTGRFDHPVKVDFEETPQYMIDARVDYSYKNAHRYYGQKVAVIGGGNSAIGAAADLAENGVGVTLLIKGSEVKGNVRGVNYEKFLRFEETGEIEVIKETSHYRLNPVMPTKLSFRKNADDNFIEHYSNVAADRVLVQCGYLIDDDFLQSAGLCIESSQRTGKNIVVFGRDCQTTIDNVYIAGVLMDENFGIKAGWEHAEKIINSIQNKKA